MSFERRGARSRHPVTNYKWFVWRGGEAVSIVCASRTRTVLPGA